MVNRQKPLKQSLSITFVLAAVVPIGIVSLLVMYYFATNTVRDITDKNLLLARTSSSHVEVFLREPLAVLENIRNIIVSSNGEDNHRMGTMLDLHVESSEVFESIYILGESGQVTHVGLPERIAGRRKDFLGLDLSHQPFYRAAMESGKAQWSDTFLSLMSGKMSLALCLPAGEKGLVGNLRIDLLHAFTRRMKVGKKMQVAIIDRKGAIIVHSNPEIAARQVNIRNLAPVREGLEGTEGSHRYIFGEEEMIGSVALIPGPGWLALVSQSAEDAFAPIRHTERIFASGIVGAVLLSFLFGLIMSRRFSAPLAEFASRARVIADGEYEFTLTPSGSLEQEELSSSFRRMASSIREREQRLKDSEERFRTLLENAADAFFLHDEEGQLLDVNQLACQSLGYSRAELLTLKVSDIAANGGGEDPADIWVKIKPGRPVTLEGVHRRKDGSTFPVETRLGVIESNGRHFFLALARDISERRQAEEEKAQLEEKLLHAQKMEAVGTLAGGIAHDFNNILHAILGFTQLLLTRSDDNSYQRRHLLEIEQSAERAADLVRSLLTFSRKTASELKPVNLNREVLRTVNILERTIPKMIRIKTRLSRDLRPINGDAVQLEQVLMNLASNARDAMQEEGLLVMETENTSLDEEFCATHPDAKPGKYVLLRVSDTGEGMTPETADHIFEPFFTTKEVGKGTGLGLSTVYGIIRSHQGLITCDSRPGEGTTFNALFPAIIDKVESSPERVSERSDLPTGDETILLVDDDETVRRLGTQSLERMGYRVVTAASGEEAITSYREAVEKPDLVILDLGMPGMGGRRCLEELLKINPEAKVMIASGYSLEAQAKGILELGARGFIGKPYKLAELGVEVRRALDP